MPRSSTRRALANRLESYLTFAGSVVAFTAYVWLLDHVRAPLVATYTFVNPIICGRIGMGTRWRTPDIANVG